MPEEEHINNSAADIRPERQFMLLWLLLFCIYYPAARAGFVTDFTGWLDQVRHHSFGEFINRSHFEAKSLYQLTQLNTWVCYKLLGVNVWAWHLLFISLHATNAYLLMRLCSGIFAAAGFPYPARISLAGAVLFCFSAYNSEVVVWEPAFHFLQGLLLILLVLHCVHKYLYSGSKWLVVAGVLLYLLSLFSLEVFYITPWLVLSLLAFFHFIPIGVIYDGRPKKAVTYFFIPMLLLFVARIAAYRLAYGDWVSRIGTASATALHQDWFGKPAKYLFHLLLMGRFWSADARQAVYAACDSAVGITLFYALALAVLVRIFTRFRSMSSGARAASLLFIWLLATLLLLLPLWFAADMLVLYDRYTYFAGAFFYMLFAVLVSMITVAMVRRTLRAGFMLVNLRYAVQVSRYWGKAAHIVDNLVQHLPNDPAKTVLLLNLPQNLQGIAMIGAEKNSEYKLLHDLLHPAKPLTNTVYDVLAYNMLTPADGAHVNVINDSLVKVTLNQWGTWWWFETRGAYSYWTADYRLDLRDAGHWYELTLRKPAAQYLLLYNVGDEWKVVDMNHKNTDQN